MHVPIEYPHSKQYYLCSKTVVAFLY